MSTLNRTFGTWGRGAEAGAGTGEVTGAGSGTGEVTAAGAGDGPGARQLQQIIWRISMARKCFEKTGQGVDHIGIYYTHSTNVS